MGNWPMLMLLITLIIIIVINRWNRNHSLPCPPSAPVQRTNDMLAHRPPPPQELNSIKHSPLNKYAKISGQTTWKVVTMYNTHPPTTGIVFIVTMPCCACCGYYIVEDLVAHNLHRFQAGRQPRAELRWELSIRLGFGAKNRFVLTIGRRISCWLCGATTTTTTHPQRHCGGLVLSLARSLTHFHPRHCLCYDHKHNAKCRRGCRVVARAHCVVKDLAGLDMVCVSRHHLCPYNTKSVWPRKLTILIPYFLLLHFMQWPTTPDDNHHPQRGCR